MKPSDELDKLLKMELPSDIFIPSAIGKLFSNQDALHERLESMEKVVELHKRDISELIARHVYTPADTTEKRESLVDVLRSFENVDIQAKLAKDLVLKVIDETDIEWSKSDACTVDQFIRLLKKKVMEA